MDQRLRELQRAYSAEPGNTELASQLYNHLNRVYANPPLEDLIQLRDSLEEHTAYELITRISQQLYEHGIPYPTPQDWQTREFTYRNPPPGASTWALVELNESPHWEFDDECIAITTVYLCDTSRRVHIASMTPNAELHPLYPNVIQADFFDGFDEHYDDPRYLFARQAEDEWMSSIQLVEYINYHDLKNAVEWHWVPQDFIDEEDDEYPDYVVEQLREFYLGNRAL